jgi:hypothetical protein
MVDAVGAKMLILKFKRMHCTNAPSGPMIFNAGQDSYPFSAMDMKESTNSEVYVLRSLQLKLNLSFVGGVTTVKLME